MWWGNFFSKDWCACFWVSAQTGEKRLSTVISSWNIIENTTLWAQPDSTRMLSASWEMRALCDITVGWLAAKWDFFSPFLANWLWHRLLSEDADEWKKVNWFSCFSYYFRRAGFRRCVLTFAPQRNFNDRCSKHSSFHLLEDNFIPCLWILFLSFSCNVQDCDFPCGYYNAIRANWCWW